MSEITIAVVLLAIAAALIFVAFPNKDGDSPSFLRFHAAVVLYPPIVLVFLAASIAAFSSALSGTVY